MGIIRVRFVASGSFVGRSIRWVTNSLFQHVEFSTSKAHEWVGAHADGISVCGDGNYSREYVYEIPCTDSQQAQLETWIESKMGTRYNWLDIFGLLVRNRFCNSPQRLICSQFVTGELLRVFGANRVLNVLPSWTYRITPETCHLSPIFVDHLVSKRS